MFSCFQRLKSLVEKESNRRIRCLRSDGGKDYVSGAFTTFLEKEGIRREYSCRYTLQQNGVVERKNRSIVEVARTMLEEKHLPKQCWTEAVCTAVYLLNRSSTEGARITPHQAYFGRKPNMAHLRVFGSIAYVHIPDEKRKKLDPKSEKCVFVGYLQSQKG